MTTYLFTDNDTFHKEIIADSFKGALLKAKSLYGIRVAMRCIETVGNAKAYKSSVTGYCCEIKRV
jgi:hypothetical protein